MKKQRRKRRPYIGDNDSIKTFKKYAHRIYFVTDISPHDAFYVYAYATRTAFKEAAQVLAYLPQNELDWAERYIKNYNNTFRYSVSFYSKMKYIEHLKEKYEV